mmetsp:Transcript_31789/g.69497  ORF Transcript_31789/g.69497 Transcript_31789/m.69497 type:complete len:521 (-) Transcript_31789:170-1732(-)
MRAMGSQSPSGTSSTWLPRRAKRPVAAESSSEAPAGDTAESGSAPGPAGRVNGGLTSHPSSSVTRQAASPPQGQGQAEPAAPAEGAAPSASSPASGQKACDGCCPTADADSYASQYRGAANEALEALDRRVKRMLAEQEAQAARIAGLEEHSTRSTAARAQQTVSIRLLEEQQKKLYSSAVEQREEAQWLRQVLEDVREQLRGPSEDRQRSLLAAEVEDEVGTRELLQTLTGERKSVEDTLEAVRTEKLEVIRMMHQFQVQTDLACKELEHLCARASSVFPQQDLVQASPDSSTALPVQGSDAIFEPSQWKGSETSRRRASLASVQAGAETHEPHPNARAQAPGTTVSMGAGVVASGRSAGPLGSPKACLITVAGNQGPSPHSCGPRTLGAEAWRSMPPAALHMAHTQPYTHALVASGELHPPQWPPAIRPGHTMVQRQSSALALRSPSGGPSPGVQRQRSAVSVRAADVPPLQHTVQRTGSEATIRVAGYQRSGPDHAAASSMVHRQSTPVFIKCARPG